MTKREAILRVLRDGAWHGGDEFLDGRHGFRTSAYAQRISELRRDGHRIEASGRGGQDLGRYRLLAEAPSATATCSRDCVHADVRRAGDTVWSGTCDVTGEVVYHATVCPRPSDRTVTEPLF